MYQYTTTKWFIYTNGGQMHFCCNDEEIYRRMPVKANDGKTQM